MIASLVDSRPPGDQVLRVCLELDIASIVVVLNARLNRTTCECLELDALLLRFRKTSVSEAASRHRIA